MLNQKTILITGGTGSFGNAFTEYVLSHYKPKKIIIYSRDEYKQFVMAEKFKEHKDSLRFFIGDVRDRDRLYRAFDGVNQHQWSNEYCRCSPGLQGKKGGGPLHG